MMKKEAFAFTVAVSSQSLRNPKELPTGRTVVNGRKPRIICTHPAASKSFHNAFADDEQKKGFPPSKNIPCFRVMAAAETELETDPYFPEV